MRISQFDALLRAVGNNVSRRSALGLLTLAASLFTLDTADARNRKHRKRRRVRSRRRRRRKDQRARKGAVCKRAGSRACELAQAAPGQDLRNCNLANGALVWANLSGAKASRANLSGAHLLGSELDGADISRACMAGATLRNASLRGANLDGADLGGADLCGADLRGAQVTNAQLSSASACCSTRRSDGSSAAPCSPGRTCCDGGCIDLTTSSANCGACGNTCAAGQVCCEGACVVPGGGQRCSTPDPVCIPSSQDLQQVFDEAEDNVTIHLCAGTWQLTNTLLIAKNLTILGSGDGQGTVLDGGWANIQIVGIRQHATVEFKNVTFTNGVADEGAGLFNQGYLTLYNCQVTRNSARQGGGVYNEGTVRVFYGSFADNIVTPGSAPFNPDYSGGAIYNDEGTVYVEGTAFTHNLANVANMDDGEGGAIFNYYGQVTLSPGTQVTDNHAIDWGGGIYNDGGRLVVQAGTSITSNAAGNGGGGIYADGGSYEIAAGAVINNTPDDCDGSLKPNCT
ncbi:MAG: pentapeptide repeat-containing protein [Thermomicrobiales bacterium]|nr:pentapeptide repeat-containing protein [Thermomicrobiales bacterium]